MDELNITVYVATQEKSLSIKCSKLMCAEQLCTRICRQLNVTPIAKHLFSLQIHDTKMYLEDNSQLDAFNIFDLRIRYKVPNIARLKQLDHNAYNYYFHQVRKDVLDNNIPEIQYSKFREELLGLGISDMYRVMKEDGISQQDIMRDYKKYIPKEVTKKHSIFTKKPIYYTLDGLQKKNLTPSYVIEKYINQFNTMAPNYLSEEYKVMFDRNNESESGTLFVMPFHDKLPGLQISLKGKEIEHLCTIGELCFMTIREDGTVEICRKNGIPLYLKFTTVPHMKSFVSICDGYYRLMIKWTFNICKDMPSPQLIKLHNMKCHGPVGGIFSYHKLEEKRSNKPGSYILRQCEQMYDVYYIDVCKKNSLKPMTYKIEKKSSGFIFDNNETVVYPSIGEIINAYKSSEDDINLQDCLPPSDYDKSQVLLCQSIEPILTSNIYHDDLDDILKGGLRGPHCISANDLQIYRSTKQVSSENLSYVYKAKWNVVQGKKMDVALKILKEDTSETHLKDFIDDAGKWAFLKSSAVVRLYGITLQSPVAMVMEWLPYGALDIYLRNRDKKIQIVDLVEAAASLATALWHLDENGIVHGNIRCRKLLVASHDSTNFTIKLSDQGLHSAYHDYDIHWIPVEFYNNTRLARKSTSTDVWAFATTLWEIFSYGKSPNELSQPLTKKQYISGSRLTIPIDCPEVIYSTMRDCWVSDPHSRARPQAIMRDVNKLLYQVFNSRRKHHDYTKLTQMPCSVDDGHLSPAYDERYKSSDSTTNTDFDFDDIPCDIINQWNDPFQNIYEFEDYNVVLQGIIGEGFYGFVYRGMLQKEENGQTKDIKTIAIKMLKSNCQSDDFYQEIKIAKTLHHPNIVEIYGIVKSPDIMLIMEYIPDGSLSGYLKIHRLKITTKQLLKYALDVAQGMEYLETLHVVHRDLAARNILVIDENHVKITDFGLAREIDNRGYYQLKSNRELPLNWYAPESKTKGKFSSKSDVWSYGITLWEMFSYGGEPLQSCQTITDDSLSSRLPCPASCPNEVYTSLMLACWKFEPSERLTFSQLTVNCEKLLPQFQ